jgi:putative endonuclease
MFCVYVIENSLGKIYTGYTANFENRLKRHNGFLPTKKTSYTYKNGGDWKLIYKEEFNARIEAIKRERELKSFKGREFVKNYIKSMRP